MKSLDFRLKILIGVAILGAVAVMALIVLDGLVGNAAFRFGSTEHWATYESPFNNVSFRYPEGSVQIVTPTNERNVPVSLMLAGERGENMLIQFGTLRREEVYGDVDEAITAYERRFLNNRETRERHRFTIQGREGVTLIQEETNGRTVGETFFYDPAVVNVPHALNEATFPTYEIREISLQLPARASVRDQKLYTELYLMILGSVQFLEEPQEGVPQLIPNAWRRMEDGENGFALHLPPDWQAVGVGEYQGLTEVVFEALYGERNESQAEYRVAAFPAGQHIDAAFLEEAFAQPYRESAFPDTLDWESGVTIPGVGEAISLQARQPKVNPADGNEMTTLLLIVAGDDTPQPGRGYIVRTALPDGTDQQELRLDQIRAMTRTLTLISSGEVE